MIKFRITGQNEIAKALQGLPARIAKDVAVQAMEQAVQPLVTATQALTPIGETGGLRRSIGFAVRKYKRVVYGVIGARYGFGTTDADGNQTDPAKYAHLVEFGHAVAGNALAWVDAQPFLRPAWDATKAAVLAILGEQLGAGIEAQAALSAQKMQKIAQRAGIRRARAVALGAPVN